MLSVTNVMELLEKEGLRPNKDIKDFGQARHGYAHEMAVNLSPTRELIIEGLCAKKYWVFTDKENITEIRMMAPICSSDGAHFDPPDSPRIRNEVAKIWHNHQPTGERYDGQYPFFFGLSARCLRGFDFYAPAAICTSLEQIIPTIEGLKEIRDFLKEQLN